MTTTNTIPEWTNRLIERPDVFPHQLDLATDRVLLVMLSAAERKAASFLDQRVFTSDTKGSWVPWHSIAESLPTATPVKVANFIFHVSHCGSTLLSRLLEFAPDTEGLREPLILRTLAQDMADNPEGRSFLTKEEQLNRLQVLSKLWTRSARHTIVKATSICTDLMPHMLSHAPDSKAVFIYNQPDTHLETLLAGQNAITDLKNFAQLRIQRMRQMTDLDIRLERLTIGQLAALSWLSETTRAAITLEELSAQITLVDFDSFLQQPEKTLQQLLQFLDIPATDETARKAISSPVMRTYSKAPEYEYSANTRSALLAEARVKFRNEISDGLRWLDKLAKQSAPVAQALHRFGQ